MVEVSAFRGVFYDTAKVGGLERVVSLPYDIISPGNQEEYYRYTQYNVIRLILGKDEPAGGVSKYERARRFLDDWLKRGVLVQDREPGIYVYQQEYVLDGVAKKQTGFIALVKLEPFEAGVILPHERVYGDVIEDRYRLLEATEADLESIMTLYSDPSHKIKALLSQTMESKPLFEIKHADDILHRMWAIRDKKTLKDMVGLMKDKKLYIADGHHRYTTCLRYYQNQGGGERPCKYMMMLLLDMGDDLTVMAPHRLLKVAPGFRVEDALSRLGRFFRVRECERNGRERLVADLKARRSRHTFGLVFRDRCFLLSLKKSDVIDDLLDSSKSKHWNELDVTILHDVVLDYLLELKGVDIKFVKDLRKVFRLVDDGEYQMAFLINPPEVRQVKAIADSGEVMPQKSTYFYPKVLSGLVMYKF